MKKIALVGLIAVAATVTLTPRAEAHGRRHHHHHRPAFHSRVIVGFGPSFYWGPPPYWYYPRPYVVYAPPPVVYTPPPVVVQEQPSVYIQQAPPPVAAPAPAAEQFWYYCQSAGGYYPSVPSCPEAWVRVAPRP